MSKVPKTVNKFSRSHEGLRKFLRLLSYGCYHRNLFMRHEIKPRSYDDFLRRIRFFVPEENLQVTWYEKCAYFTFVGDFRHGNRNFYRVSFQLKTLLAEHCLHKIILLRVLECEQKLPKILERAQDLAEVHNPSVLTSNTDLPQLFRRRLTELTDAGIVRRIVKGKKFLYEKLSNPLGKLSSTELRSLYIALEFWQNVAPVGMAGYFLSDGLKNFYDVPESVCEIFQFKNNNFARILDDDILLTVFEGIRQGKKLLVERENKSPVTITPLFVETDFLHSRQYLIALADKELMRLRVEKITAVTLVKDDEEEFLPPRKKLREVRLRVKFETPQERQLREKVLTAELSAELVKELAGELIFVVKTPDPLQIYPRLWQFQPWAEILSGADGLRERMLLDALEALKNYEEFI